MKSEYPNKNIKPLPYRNQQWILRIKKMPAQFISGARFVGLGQSGAEIISELASEVGFSIGRSRKW